MKHVTNYLAVAAGLFTVVLSQSAQANGVPLTDPGIVVPVAASASGNIIAQETTTLVNDSVNPGPLGTITSFVLNDDPFNPFSGAGGLTFVYQIAVSVTSPTFLDIFSSTTVWPVLSGMSVGDTDVKNSIPEPGDIAPSEVSRIGGVLTWTYLTEVNAGQTTDYMIVDSSVTSYTNPFWSVQDGGQSESRAFAPGIPDGGTTVTLLGGALLAISALRRKLS